MNEEILYLNGQFQLLSEGRISIEDRGFQLGDGVYEVIKVLNGTIIWLEDHLERLESSLRAIRLVEVLDDYSFATILPELVKRSAISEGYVYLQITRGYAPREFTFPRPAHPTVLAYARAKKFPTREEIYQGLVLYPVEDLRWAHCDIKSTNLLAAVLAKEEAWEAGADEALFVSSEGIVREGGSSNVFAVIDGVLRTHPLNNRILGGITRKYILIFAEQLGIPVKEEAFNLNELIDGSGNCTEVFSASTTKDLVPVNRVGETVIGDGQPGPVTLGILEAMQKGHAKLTGLPEPAPLN